MNDHTIPSGTKSIEELRSKLLKDQTVLQVNDLGAGSMINKSNARTIASICRNTSKSKKLALLLLRIVRKYQPATILELGTSLGISTAYLAMGNPSARVITCEGSETVATIASRNFSELGILNIEIIKGNFDAVIPNLIGKPGTIDLIFIDGNHREEPTLRYFNWLLNASNPNTIMIFDDIHWSRGMDRAWEKIKADRRVRMTIDLFFVGIVLFREEFKVKQDFIIRY